MSRHRRPTRAELLQAEVRRRQSGDSRRPYRPGLGALVVLIFVLALITLPIWLYLVLKVTGVYR